MTVRPCPFCNHQTPRLIDVASAAADVNYHRCRQCGAVWTVTKRDPQGEPKIVVQGKRSQP